MSPGGRGVVRQVDDREVQTCNMEYCLDDGRSHRPAAEGHAERAKARLEKDVGKFSSEGIKISTEVVEGIPYMEILKYQDLNKVDLVVIATHGRSAIAKYFLGSVSSNVLKGATCEVLLVR